MAAWLVRSFLPVVSKVKFGSNVPRNFEKCKHICPEASVWVGPTLWDPLERASLDHRTKSVSQLKPNKNLYPVHLYHSRTKKSMAFEPTAKDLSYDDIIAFKRGNEIILIDVREPSEIKETGRLPGSVHIPLGELKNALQVLSPEDFLKKYGTDKPKLDANLVFSCRSGKRSKTAMETAMSIGFLNSRHYAGGFLDWQKHHPS